MTGLVSSASAVICKMSDVINVWEYITFAYIQLFINLFCVNFIRHNNFNPEIIYVLGVQSFTWDDVNCWTEVKIQILMIFFFSLREKQKISDLQVKNSLGWKFFGQISSQAHL